MALSLNKLPWYAQIGIFAGASIAAVAAFHYLYAAPAQAELAARQQQLDVLRRDINRGLATAQRLPEFRRQVADLEARLNELKAALPEEKDVADLLRRFQTLATQSSLTIVGFKPGPANARQLHSELPHMLEIEGTYHNLGLFLDRVSKLSRVINVGLMDIKARQKQEPNATITVVCTATTFVMLDPSKQPPPPPPTGPARRPASQPGTKRS
jgi:type IV pilus assembly protein PilO